MNLDGTPEKVPPAPREKITRSTPLESPQPPLESTLLRREEEDQEFCSCGMEHGGEHRWTARDRGVMARMVQYLDRNGSLIVEIEELEDCVLGPERSHRSTSGLLR